MNQKLLVTYASRTGSTAEIAEAIYKTLTQAGYQADLLPMQDVSDVSRYSGVVIGSPIRKTQWLPEALKFIQNHSAVLSRMPVAMFTVCVTLAMKNGEQYRHAVASWVSSVRSQVRPVSEAFFAGKLDFEKLPINFDTLKMRLTVALNIFPKDDRRDWKAIHAWAESLPQLLMP